MKIAQVAPLFESVPPKFYGGTERIVSYLTEELVRQGHQVTLFASGDSETKARLIAPTRRSIRLDKNCVDQLAHHVCMLGLVMKMAHEFDIVHYHIDYLHFPSSKYMKVPSVTTLHGRLDIPDLIPLYKEFPEIPVISISNNQRKPLSWINWQGTVYHGLPENLYTFREDHAQYLAFLGRFCREKRVDRAIRIAKHLGLNLKIAAKVDPLDREYFKQNIEPLLDDPLVDFVGEIGEGEKNEFLGNACALLFPIDWPEPFGLVMIEAMACGTPVIAYREGSVPEIIQDGVTGFVVAGFESAVTAVQKVSQLNRKRCRQVFEEQFSVKRMARDYLAVYEKVIREKM